MEETVKKPELLVIAQAGTFGTGDSIFYLFHAETGEPLASHICSHESYAMEDLYADRPERIKRFKERWGEVEVKYLKETDITLKELIRRNAEWGKQHIPETKPIEKIKST